MCVCVLCCVFCLFMFLGDIWILDELMKMNLVFFFCAFFSLCFPWGAFSSFFFSRFLFSPSDFLSAFLFFYFFYHCYFVQVPFQHSPLFILSREVFSSNRNCNMISGFFAMIIILLGCETLIFGVSLHAWRPLLSVLPKWRESLHGYARARGACTSLFIDVLFSNAPWSTYVPVICRLQKPVSLDVLGATGFGRITMETKRRSWGSVVRLLSLFPYTGVWQPKKERWSRLLWVFHCCWESVFFTCSESVISKVETNSKSVV